MKKLILSTVLGLVMSFAAVAQNVLKLRAFATTEMHKYQDGSWSSWAPWNDTDILIVIDAPANRITIYTETHQTYDILTDDGESRTDDGERVLNYTCVDENGSRCAVRLIKRSNGVSQLYADFSNVVLCYNLKVIR
jgi:hypothetical protein